MKKILVVDDEPDILKLLSIEIEDYDGFELDYALNGKAALDLLLKNKYDGLITDLKMPIMDGKELLLKIKENSIDIGVIFVISGNPKEFHLQELAELGVHNYIQKPYDPGDMLDIVTSHLE